MPLYHGYPGKYSNCLSQRTKEVHLDWITVYNASTGKLLHRGTDIVWHCDWFCSFYTSCYVTRARAHSHTHTCCEGVNVPVSGWVTRGKSQWAALPWGTGLICWLRESLDQPTAHSTQHTTSSNVTASCCCCWCEQITDGHQNLLLI